MTKNRVAENKKGNTLERVAFFKNSLKNSCLGLSHHATPIYLAADLPKRLRNFSTRPPILSTDFWVPV